MFRRTLVVTSLGILGLALVALAIIPSRTAAQAGSTSGFVVDQTYDAVWGTVTPGAIVTVARGTAYGAAQADGIGFFWTPLWQSNGRPADITGTDVVRVYVSGSLSATITVSGVTGLVDVLNDRVVGKLGGVTAPTPVTITIGTDPGSPGATTATDASGRFTATFTTVDLGPGSSAVVEYRAGPHTMRAFLAPDRVFAVYPGWNEVVGYAQPGQAVTATVYDGSGPTIKTVITGQADRARGLYDLYPSDATGINGGDVVEVNLGGGVIISTTVVAITMNTDPDTNLVTGTAPAGAVLRASLRRQTDDQNPYYQVTTTVGASGVYTADLSAVVEVQVYDWIDVALADSRGNETIASSGAPMININETNNRGWARVDGPNLTVTSTLDTGSSIYTQTGVSGPHNFVSLGRFPGNPDIQPGHRVTVETASWLGAMTVADLSVSFDTAGNRLLGDAPPGRVEARISHPWSDRYPAGLGSVARQVMVTLPFTLTYSDFDVRDGDNIWLVFFNSDGFRTVRSIDARFFQVQAPNGVGAPQFSPSDVLTATLYESDGVTVKRQTSQDDDSNSDWYRMDMQGEIAVGDWVTVTDGAGWTAGLQVPALTVQANDATDLIWGQGPKSLLLVQRNWDWQSARFVPCDDYRLDAAYFGQDIQQTDWIQTTHFALNGDRVVREFEFPWMRVNYAHDWVGAVYPADHTFWITVTNSGGTVKATAALSTTTGAGWGADGFETRRNDWSPPGPDIQAGDWIYARSEEGYSNTIHVGTITGTVDVGDDSVGGTVYAAWFTQTLDVECHPWGAPGGAPVKNSTAAPDGSAPYFCQWDPSDWDILPGQDVAVMYIEPDRDRVINVFHEPAPNLYVEKWVQGDSEAAPGGPIVFGIRYQNQGDGAGQAILTDTLPTELTYVTDTSGHQAFVSGSVITWNLGTVQPMTVPVEFQLVLTNSASADDTLENRVDIGALYETDWNDNQSSASVHVTTGTPDLYVGKDAQPGDPTPGQLFRYNIHYGNNGPVASGPVWLTDTLPLSTTFVSWESENGYDLWTAVITTGGRVVLLAPTLPGNGWGDTIWLTLRLSDTVPYDTQLVNTVEITTTDDSNPDDNQQVNDWTGASQPRYDVRVDKNWGNGTLVPGGDVYFWVNYANSGNTVAHDVVLTDTLPNGATFITSVLDLGWGVEVPFPPSSIAGHQLRWNLGSLQVNAQREFRVQLRINSGTPAGAVLTNCVAIASHDFPDNPYDNADCTTETVRAAGPNLRVTKFADWQNDNSIRYWVSIENIGTTTANTVTITDTFPVSMTLNGRNINVPGGWGPWSSGQSGNQLTVTLNRLEPGWTTNLRMNLSFSSAPNGTLFTNTAQITTPPGDVNPSDNSSVLVIGTGPDLSIEKWLSGGTASFGQLLTYTLHFENDARWGTVGHVWITDTLPTGLVFVSATQRLCGTYFCERTPDRSSGSWLAWDWNRDGTVDRYWWNDYVVTVRVVSNTLLMSDVLTNTATIASGDPNDVEPFYDNNTSVCAVTTVKYRIYLPVVMRQ